MQTRSEVVIRRTYSRPVNDGFESWMDICLRVKGHQKWLWERQIGRELNKTESVELESFYQLMIDKKVSTSGRTLWLGGTETAKHRESSMFNCSGTVVETVYDVVDVIWLLLQGCGVGFKPKVGILNGFKCFIPKITTIPTTRKSKGGKEHNKETWNKKTGVWTIQIGDSAESWARFFGKVIAGKYAAKELVLDFSQIRPAGFRLKGYGWLSSGDESLTIASLAICEIMNKRSGELLTRIDILDIVNWLGTVLSSRRSAEIALFEYGEPEWEEFSTAKSDFCIKNTQRRQSNNSLVFKSKPSEKELSDIFKLMVGSGGSEPGFINGEAALSRAPWFNTLNPCAEIILGNKGFCNLVEIDVSKFIGDSTGLHEALRLAARANYRQTCVQLKDGVLQEAWHLNNEFLRLCGVGLTGIAQRQDLSAYDLRTMERVATTSAYSMADELGLQRPKNVTTVKPSGTLSKVFGCPEGIHKPLGKYIFNKINFGKYDPLLPALREANYEVIDNPNDIDGVLVTFPVAWEHTSFTDLENGTSINTESAITQLERYKLYQVNWCHQNVSNTISYSIDEVDDIISWLLHNWDIYVGVSFIFRSDPTKTAEDLGYKYLPQQVVTKDSYDEYVATLKPFIMPTSDTLDNEISGEECAGGVCPVK